MGCFGISEGAIPFAAARPAQVIPANMLGGAVAGAIAGLAGVKDAVPHGGPIVAVLGAVGGVPMFFVAVAIGTAVTALTTVTLVDLSERKRRGETLVAVPLALAPAPAPAPVLVGVGAGASAGAATAVRPQPLTADSTTAPVITTTPATTATEPEVLSGYLTEQTVKVRLDSRDKESAIREMAGLLAATGKVADVEELVRTALRREAQGTTGLGEEIAIPHAKTDAVTAPIVGFARSAEGIEWGALDGTKAKLVFMISVPEAAAGDEHLRILALLSRKLMDPGFRERLTAAEDERAILGVLGEIQ
jgi:PTS system fructose-specific IIC component